MKQVGYIRVSTNEQNFARQQAALLKYLPEDMIVTDKKSGKDFERPGYSSLKHGIGKLVRGDELFVTSIDRLGRNKAETLKELQYFKENGIRLKVLDIPTTMVDISALEGQTWVFEMINNILIEVLTSVAEQELKTIRRRSQEGVAQMPLNPKTGKKRSLRTGRDVGRPKAMFPDNWKDVYESWKAGRITAVQAMKDTELTKSTFYNLVKRYETCMEQKKSIP
ncbi:recombinase family protein [Faecalimonas umbilicata]|nr:recombinase family protein [Faecalimonas umbilicata]